MNIVSGNVRSNPVMRRAAVRSSLIILRQLGGIVGFQEIAPLWYRSLLKRIFAEYRLVNIDYAIPLAFRRKYWRVLSERIQRTHKGRPMASPHRYFGGALIQHRIRSRKLAAFWVYNSHFVSGAWNPKPKLFKAWRQKMWLRHYEMYKAEVLARWQAGFTVFFMADWNRADVEKFHPDQIWLSTHGIDKIGVLIGENGPWVELIDADHEDDPSDHDAVWAKLRLLAEPPKHLTHPTRRRVATPV